MSFEYKVNAEDLITYSLFAASKNARIIKSRRNGKLGVPVVYFILGVLSLFLNQYTIGVCLWLFAIGWYFIYPIWLRRYYVNFYKNVVKENYKTGLDKVSKVQINDDVLIVQDDASEMKMSTKEFMEINEIANYLFVRTKNGGRWIIPKEQVENIEILVKELKALSLKLNIPYNLDYSWKWK